MIICDVCKSSADRRKMSVKLPMFRKATKDYFTIDFEIDLCEKCLYNLYRKRPELITWPE